MKLIQLGLLVIWLIVSTYYLPYSLIYRNLKSLKFLTVALMLQNLMSLFASNTLPGFVSQYIILYKEIILWGTFVFVFIQRLKIKKVYFQYYCFQYMFYFVSYEEMLTFIQNLYVLGR